MPGRLVLREKTGWQCGIFGETIDEPFKRNAIIEREHLPEALGELLVAHDGRVGDGDTAVFQPAFHSAGTGAEYGFAAGKSGTGDGVVKSWIKIGETGSEAQPVTKGAGGGGPGRGDVLGRGRAAEGGGCSSFLSGMSFNEKISSVTTTS